MNFIGQDYEFKSDFPVLTSPQFCQDIAQGAVQPEGAVSDVIGDINFSQLDGHIDGVWFLGHQAHQRCRIFA